MRDSRKVGRAGRWGVKHLRRISSILEVQLIRLLTGLLAPP